jgi:hypothetical protein
MDISLPAATIDTITVWAGWEPAATEVLATESTIDIPDWVVTTATMVATTH